MIADERLPGEEALSPSRTLRRVPLDAFKRLDWPKNFDRFFLTIMLINSSARRNNAGPSGLIAETARDIIANMIPDLKRLYLSHDIFVAIGDAELDRLASELADEVTKRSSFRAETIAAMKLLRSDIATELAYDEYLTAYIEMETAVGTLNRWLDYVKLRNKLGFSADYFFVYRLLISCLRLYDAVFGTNNLHVRRD
jgi:hypothetical protein